MYGNLLSYAGWTFLPNMVTGWVQSLYYGITIRAGDPKPQPGSPRFATHRRRIFILMVSLYLLYTIYEADWEIRRAGDFYQSLGVPLDADEKTIRSKFRRLAALYHPDKTSQWENRASSENHFMHLRLAQDTLLEPAKRFAYDRFGPDITQWRHCVTMSDYIVIGLQELAPLYSGGLFVMIGLGFFGYLGWGRYWRFLSYIALLAFEINTVTRPYFPSITTKIFNPLFATFTWHPPYLPFQQLILFRKLLVTIHIALSHLGPYMQPTEPSGQANDEAAQHQQLDRLDQVSKVTDLEASRLLGLDMAPFANDERTMGELRARLQEWLVQNTIRTDPDVRDAVGRVMGKRRTGAPTGARGTRTHVVPPPQPQR
ncbi:MAG: hypothetical protein M1837_007061 [Sclerophora amabilis]|nr:MAG: hypothetical protein M1837_007061 [Sclerophora amabilis]